MIMANESVVMTTFLANSSMPIAKTAASDEFLSLVPRRFARRHLVISIGRVNGVDGVGGMERVAAVDGVDPCVIHNLGVRLGVAIEVCSASGEDIAQAIDRHYGLEVSDAPDQPSSTSEDEFGSDLAERDLLSTQGKADVVRLVDSILFEALSRGASDVHVQPLADRTLVRVRVDGVLHTTRELPAPVAAAVVSRIKIMGRMDVAERAAPQDGRATVSIGRQSVATLRSSGDQEFGGDTHAGADAGAEIAAVSAAASDSKSGDPRGRTVDLRISTLPTSYGERAVVRLLDNTRGEHLKDFAALGMPTDVQTRFLERVNRAHGIVLVTGPTGSGKTTTLYAALRWVAGDGQIADAKTKARRSAGELNVMTIEDPIEYELSTVGVAVSQSQVNVKKGVTFAAGLRHILRQDPDVVMVGEIRDTETARIAIQASLTGHLVLSTLHTNDAAGALTRLVDLGVESYLVAASLSAVLAQRLVRRCHASCAGRGCDVCLHSGFAGRVGVFELLRVDDGLRDRVVKGATGADLRSAARAAGMRSLMDEGRRLSELGVTTMLEVERVISGTEE